MSGDVVLHVLVGEATIAFLVLLLFDGAKGYLVGGVVSACILKEVVFVGADKGGSLSESSIHYESSVFVIDLKSVFHNYCSFSCSLLS